MKRLFVFILALGIFGFSLLTVSCRKEISRETMCANGLITNRTYVPQRSSASVLPNQSGGVSVLVVTIPEAYITTIYLPDLDREIQLEGHFYYEKTKGKDAVELQYMLIRFDDGTFKIKKPEIIKSYVWEWE